MTTVDAHAHLTDPRFAPDLEDVLARAHDAGVGAILSCGEDVASSERAIALGERYPEVAVAVGVHPHRAPSCDARAIARLRELARHPAVVAIGEIGIDLSGRSAPRGAQEIAFASQVRLAAELDLPVVVHVRDAGAVVRALLDGLPRVRGQLHCYSEGADEVEAWIALGLHLSFAGTLTYPRSERLRTAVTRVPSERLLFETDSPYLTPEPRRGKRNEPAFVLDTIAAAARERGASPARLAEQAGRNAGSLFGRRLAASP